MCVSATQVEAKYKQRHICLLLQRCETTYPVPGDGIDNDCDRKIDEEICEGDGLLLGKHGR